MAVEINDLHIGVPVGDREISVLLYADDIVIVSDSEDKLQRAITALSHWCQRWRMVVNETKTQIVHFRGQNCDRTNFIFLYNGKSLDIVPKYKYLGVVLDEFLNFEVTADTLCDAAGRALGAVISRIHKYRDFRFNTFTTLFNSCVVPIVDYCSGILGYADNMKCDSLQNRAIRYFLGVHKFTPKLAINGDMGWISSSVRRKLNILRFWNRVIHMSDNRVTKVAFLWDYNLRVRNKNWSNDLLNMLRDIGLHNKFLGLEVVNLDDALCKLKDSFERNWFMELSKKPKLRTYVSFKKKYETEKYLLQSLSRPKRSMLAQFRTGILPLKVETGRFQQLPVEDRTCDFCSGSQIEDERHFLFDCSLYMSARKTLFDEVRTVYPDFDNLDSNDKMELLMVKTPAMLANFIFDAYNKRKETIYNV